jgi:hypothetical protein
MSQLAFCFDPPAPVPAGVWVDRWPDSPGCPGARIFIRPQTLADEHGRMGAERRPGLVTSRTDLLRQVDNYREPLDEHYERTAAKTRANQAGWLQWQLFMMGGMGAAW